MSPKILDFPGPTLRLTMTQALRGDALVQDVKFPWHLFIGLHSRENHTSIPEEFPAGRHKTKLSGDRWAISVRDEPKNDPCGLHACMYESYLWV
jgi:hypothetical protein